MLNRKIPDVVFKTRVRDETLESDNPFRWQDVTTDQYFAGKRSILFSLPGAFTPICSTFQLPEYERLHGEFSKKGIDDIFCISYLENPGVFAGFAAFAKKKTPNSGARGGGAGRRGV